MILREEVDLMEVDKLVEGGEETMTDGEVEDSKDEKT
jgi:hypothetical protein